MLNNVPMYISGSAWGVWEGHIHLLNANTLFIHFKLVKRLLVHADQAAANQTAAANDARAKLILAVNIDTRPRGLHKSAADVYKLLDHCVVSTDCMTCVQ